MPEERSIISSSRVTAGDVTRHSFGTIRRGFDPQEVRAYLEVVGRELKASEEREQQLRHQLVEAENRAQHPVLDESTLSAALGQQSAQVLRGAHEEAARIVSQAEEAAAAALREIQAQANDIQIRAESAAAERIAEAELGVGALQQQIEAESKRALDAARAQGESIVGQARAQGLDMLEQAQLARKKVLGDLVARRRSLNLQIEQFRAARDEIAAAVNGVRGSVDVVLGDLANADDKARAAAADVARRMPIDPPPGTESEEVEALEATVAMASETHVTVIESPTRSKGAAKTEPIEAEAFSTTDELEVVGSADGGDNPSVEGLFARLRAGQEGPPPAPPAPPTPLQSVTSDSAIRLVEPLVIDQGDDEQGGPSPEDQALLDARAVLMEPITAKLARRLKRTLQDDQNRLLDQIRSHSSGWRQDMLFSEEEQRAPFTDAASELLSEAVCAGIGFAHNGQPPNKLNAHDTKLTTAMASDLATTVVTLLRRPLTSDGAAAMEGEEAVERVSAAYREWRGERIERLVGDFVLGAFSAGVISGSVGVGGTRWVLAGAEPGCPDCDDNSLAGVLAPGEEFPTGHRHPPAHAGCRCLLAPAAI